MVRKKYEHKTYTWNTQGFARNSTLSVHQRVTVCHGTRYAMGLPTAATFLMNSFVVRHDINVWIERGNVLLNVGNLEKK